VFSGEGVKLVDQNNCQPHGMCRPSFMLLKPSESRSVSLKPTEQLRGAFIATTTRHSVRAHDFQEHDISPACSNPRHNRAMIIHTWFQYKLKKMRYCGTIYVKDSVVAFEISSLRCSRTSVEATNGQDQDPSLARRASVSSVFPP